MAKHKTKKDRIWVTYKSGVYDITEFVEGHPGGSKRIMMAAGVRTTCCCSSAGACLQAAAFFLNTAFWFQTPVAGVIELCLLQLRKSPTPDWIRNEDGRCKVCTILVDCS